MNKTTTTPDTTAIDALTRRVTAFRTFAELIAPGDYVPTLGTMRGDSVEAQEEGALAHLFDRAMMKRGDSRRAYRGANPPRRPRRTLVRTPGAIFNPRAVAVTLLRGVVGRSIAARAERMPERSDWSVAEWCAELQRLSRARRSA